MSASLGSPCVLENPLLPCSALLLPSIRLVADVAFRLPWQLQPPHLLYGARSHGPFARCLRFGSRVAPKSARLASSCDLLPWLGGVGYPQGFISRFQLMAASSSTRLWLAHQEDRKIGRRELLGSPR